MITARGIREAWRAWLDSRPSTTVRARLYDLRELADYLRIPSRSRQSDETRARAAAAGLLALGPSRARAKIAGFYRWSIDRANPSSIARRLATIASWIAECQHHGLTWTIPIRRPKVARVSARACPPWSAVEGVARALDSDEQRAALWLLAGVGLRRSELVSIAWPDVHLETTRPHVRVTRKGGAIEHRTISPRAAAALASMRRARQSPEGPVWFGQRGPLTDSGLARWVAGWGLGTPHALRRTGASELRRRGATPDQIQAWLGHTSLAHTAAYVREIDDPAGVATAMLDAPPR